MQKLSVEQAIEAAPKWTELITTQDYVVAARSIPEEAGRVGLFCTAISQLEPAELNTNSALSNPVPFPSTSILPAPFSVKSKVNVYGGGALCHVGQNVVAFVNAEDQNLCFLDLDSNKSPVAVKVNWQGTDTKFESSQIIAIGGLVATQTGIATVVEYAVGDTSSQCLCFLKFKENAKACDITQLPPLTAILIHHTEDFYGCAALIAKPTTSRESSSADDACAHDVSCDQICWAFVSWSAPNMPWDNTSLWIASLDLSKPVPCLRHRRIISSSYGHAITQPSWNEDGSLCFLSDGLANGNGFWRLAYFKKLAASIDQCLETFDWHQEEQEVDRPLEGVFCLRPYLQDSQLRHYHLEHHEFSTAPWTLGMRCYALHSQSVLLGGNCKGFWRLMTSSANGALTTLEPNRWVDCSSLLLHGSAACANSSQRLAVGLLASAEKPFEPRYWFIPSQAEDASGEPVAKKEAARVIEGGENLGDCGESPKLLHFEHEGIHLSGIWHASQTNAVTGTIVLCHSGPTACASPSYNPKIAFWTSRGYQLFDVNYRGSTGSGREFRHSLYGHWGDYDTRDTIAAANYLIEQGLASPEQIVVKGSSAGGFTALNAALTPQSPFSACVAHYAVVDLANMLEDTHRFEGGYTRSLVEGWSSQGTSGSDTGEISQRYQTRSVLSKVKRRACPILLLHGEKDRVVPPSQARQLIDELSAHQSPGASVFFSEEGHGFRGKTALADTYHAELRFYHRCFGTGGFDKEDESAAETCREPIITTHHSMNWFGDWSGRSS